MHRPSFHRRISQLLPQSCAAWLRIRQVSEPLVHTDYQFDACTACLPQSLMRAHPWSAVSHLPSFRLLRRWGRSEWPAALPQRQWRWGGPVMQMRPSVSQRTPMPPSTQLCRQARGTTRRRCWHRFATALRSSSCSIHCAAVVRHTVAPTRCAPRHVCRAVLSARLVLRH